MGPHPRPGEVTISLRPCSRPQGDGSLPPRQVPHPTLGPLGLALIIPKLYSMVPPMSTVKGIALAC